MEQEVWENISNSDFYAVSNLGKVKRLEHRKWNSHNNSYNNCREKILSINYNNSKHYGRIAIFFQDGTKKVCGIHRLVAENFINNPLGLPQVNHLDGNKENNQTSNLEWSSPENNMQHRIHILGIKPWKNGEDCNFTILTEEQVLSIPSLLSEGVNKREIAKMFGVSPSTITEITSGRSWKHLNLF
jgi:hypothetical protein